MLPLFLSFSSSNFTSRPNCYRCMLSTWISWFFPYNHSRSCLTSPDSFSALSSAFSLPALTSAAIRSLISPSPFPPPAVRSTPCSANPSITPWTLAYARSMPC